MIKTSHSSSNLKSGPAPQSEGKKKRHEPLAIAPGPMWQKTWKCHKSCGRTCAENVNYVCETESDIISLTAVTRRQVLWHRKPSTRRVRKSVRPWVASNGRKFLGHFIRHFRSQISSESSEQGHTKRINPNSTSETRFYHICILKFSVRVCSFQTFDLDLVSE